jgi:hypothetical protein
LYLLALTRARCPTGAVARHTQLAGSALASLPAWLTPAALLGDASASSGLFHDAEAHGDASLAVWLVARRSTAE